MRVLVVGLGNPVLRDDAVGVRLARDFRRRWERGLAQGLARSAAPGGDGDGAGADESATTHGSATADGCATTHVSGTVDGPAIRRRAGIDLCFLEECSLGGLTLVERLVGHDRVVILDSIRTRDGRPGDWYSFTASALRTTMNLSSVHDANFATALELGRRTGLILPPDERIAIFAVEIEDNLTFDERMSEALETAYPGYSEEIFVEIERVLGS
jgi:hydrogenase maturation protease